MQELNNLYYDVLYMMNLDLNRMLDFAEVAERIIGILCLDRAMYVHHQNPGLLRSSARTSLEAEWTVKVPYFTLQQ